MRKRIKQKYPDYIVHFSGNSIKYLQPKGGYKLPSESNHTTDGQTITKEPDRITEVSPTVNS